MPSTTSKPITTAQSTRGAVGGHCAPTGANGHVHGHFLVHQHGQGHHGGGIDGRGEQGALQQPHLKQAHVRAQHHVPQKIDGPQDGHIGGHRDQTRRGQHPTSTSQAQQEAKAHQSTVAGPPQRHHLGHANAAPRLASAAHRVQPSGHDGGHDQKAREGPRQQPEPLVRQHQQQTAEGGDQQPVHQARNGVAAQVSPTQGQPAQR